ncbi:hypothetical protein CEXT_466801 [Caerostris extrusa]|uniref:Ycf15 n=1 Tax=Caerostris extrusa TaxID=172846 RepID=A0AAV4VZH5_CAEEX|nr:hypothetical protein CEXT_466801 [Caerostris extrusa]
MFGSIKIVYLTLTWTRKENLIYALVSISLQRKSLDFAKQDKEILRFKRFLLSSSIQMQPPKGEHGQDSNNGRLSWVLHSCINKDSCIH